MKSFELNVEAIGKNARALTGIIIVDGKPLTTTYDIRAFLRRIAGDKKTITVSVEEDKQ